MRTPEPDIHGFSYLLGLALDLAEAGVFDPWPVVWRAHVRSLAAAANNPQLPEALGPLVEEALARAIQVVVDDVEESLR